jgi:ATP-binding cassette subfamily C protein LapB
VKQENIPLAEVQHDPLIGCVRELTARFGFTTRASQFDVLARGEDGKLPFHQAGPALEAAGLEFENVTARRWPRQAEQYPALLRLADGTPIVVHELNDEQALVWRPGRGEAVWEPLDELAGTPPRDFLTVWGDPDALRGQSGAWLMKAKYHWFWGELKKERKALQPVLLASLIINLLSIALPLFTMNVYDRVIPNHATASLWVLAIGVLIAFALEFSLRRARTEVLDQVGRRLDLKLSQKIFGRLLATPLGATQGSVGGLAARVSEYSIVRDFFASTTVVLIVDLCFLVLFVAVIAYIAGWLALVPLAAIAGMFAAGTILQRKMTDAAREAQSDNGLQQTMLVETIANSETLKSISGEGTMIGRWYGLAELGTRSQQRLRQISSIAVGLASSFQQVSTVSLVVGGYYLFSAGKISMGAIIAIVMLSSRSMGPAAQIALLLTRGKQAWQALSSIEGLFGWDDERRLGSSVAPTVSNEAEIRLDDLSFAYPESSVPALDSLNLTIRPGERIAIIGRVASGKSTLGRIVCGLYQPTGGAMLIGGIDSRQYRPQDIRRAYRFVGQDAALFTGSIKDNLTIGDRGIDDTRLGKAMWMSGADEFLARDAGGFDRQVGDQGRRLSGGQRAFLSLARALVSPCQLLFLDEPTGAMDSQTERHFVERLQSAISPEQTLIISTHRPALFALCDRIIVLDQGKIVADGPKDSILKQASSMP